MKAQLKVAGGNGDLPSIPGLSAAIKTDRYLVDWSQATVAILLLCVVIGATLPWLVIRLKKSKP
jgi:hypothetical protein